MNPVSRDKNSCSEPAMFCFCGSVFAHVIARLQHGGCMEGLEYRNNFVLKHNGKNENSA